jgi:hypothetical protein
MYELVFHESIHILPLKHRGFYDESLVPKIWTTPGAPSNVSESVYDFDDRDTAGYVRVQKD